MRGLAKLKYIWFLFKPMWRYGKAYMIMTLIMSVAFQPLSQVVSTLLPKYAIDAVMQHKTTAQTLTIIGGFTAIIIVVNVIQQLMQMVFMNIAQMKVQVKILEEVNTRALHTDFKWYDNPEYFTMFSYAQERYAGQVQQVSSMVPRVLQAIVT
ncbi:MAG: hypothetical protein LBN00_11910, partial [Oscillospiraceae bacterium]|nr:hypothetical protein [Oscillospiraceae bacterium]